MQTFNTLLKRGVFCIRVMTFNTHSTILYSESDHGLKYSLQGRITTQKLILIKLTNTNNSTLKHTPTIHTTHSRNIHAPKQTHLTLNTPPLRRTDPHTLAHNGSMFGDTGCGVGWSVSVTPACPSRLIFGLLVNIKGRAGLCDAMQRFSSALTAAVCFHSY